LPLLSAEELGMVKVLRKRQQGRKLDKMIEGIRSK